MPRETNVLCPITPILQIQDQSSNKSSAMQNMQRGQSRRFDLISTFDVQHRYFISTCNLYTTYFNLLAFRRST